MRVYSGGGCIQVKLSKFKNTHSKVTMYIRRVIIEMKERSGYYAVLLVPYSSRNGHEFVGVEEKGILF